MWNRSISVGEISAYYARTRTLYELNYTVSALSDGTYEWNCKGIDNASNAGWSEANWTFKVDTVNPAVNFVSPTPGNGSSQTSVSLTVKVEGSENLGAGILVWRGVNYSMSCSADECEHSLSGLSVAIYNYYVWVNDSSGKDNRTADGMFPS